MRKYDVRIAAIAEQSILAHSRFIARDKPLAAERWLKQILTAISKLETMPRRHPPAETFSNEVGREIRRLVLGSCLAYFTIDEDLRSIEIIAFRHAAREQP